MFTVLTPQKVGITGLSGVGVPCCCPLPFMLHEISGLPSALNESGGIPVSVCTAPPMSVLARILS